MYFFIKNQNKNNFGSAVVEATLIIPIFLFAMLSLYNMCRCKLAEGIIYEAASETAEYMAEYSYLSTPNLLVPELTMPKYIDDSELIDKSVVGGVSGINYYGTIPDDGDDCIVLKVNYTLNIELPFIPKLYKDRQIVIRKRAYVGEGEQNGKKETDPTDKYVYITDNRDVYHESRMCTHLKLSVHTVSYKFAEKNGYTACEFCGDKCGNTVYVTDDGLRFHSTESCSGLKRSVYRVKLSEVKGLPGCSRCTD